MVNEKFINVNITKMLEIGIDSGSILQLQLNYLPNCYIYGHNHKLNLINIFQNMLHLINREFINTNNINNIKSEFIPIEIIDSISTITFGQNCIIIQKN